MKTEEAKQTAQAQFEQQTLEYKRELYQTYATEELGLDNKKAKKFAEEIEQESCATQFRQYQTEKAKGLFYTWYYMNCCSQPFINGFPQWLQVYNTLLREAHLHGPVPITTPYIKQITQVPMYKDLFDLAKKWADDFELQFHGENWSNKDFQQTLHNYGKEKCFRTYTTVLEYLKGPGYYFVWKVVDGEEYPVESSEIEAAITNNDRDIFFFPTSLMIVNSRQNHITSMHMAIFFERHKESTFVRVLHRDNNLQSIAISVVCDDKNIIKDLVRLDLTGTLL